MAGVKRVAAAGILAGFGIALLFATEGILALTGVRPLSRDDLFVGFEQSQPLFEPREMTGEATKYSLNPAKDKHFNPQELLMPKPEGVFRIISYGGSTTYGRPFINRTSFPTWTARILQHSDPSRTYESINAGGISYASFRIRRLMDELAQFSPDLYVLYCGHNEFLERRTFEAIIGERPVLRRLRSGLHASRIYTLLYRAADRLALRPVRRQKNILAGEVEALLDSVGPQAYHRDPVFREGAISQYKINIQLIVEFCRDRKIPLVISTLPCNLSDFSPFKSEHRENITTAELEGWEKAFAQGSRALGLGQHAAALEAFAVAERIDDRYAMLHFLKGKALEGLERWEEAYRSFVQAKEEDIVPMRVLEVFNEILRETARREGVPLVDVEALFRSLSPHGIPGANLFADYIHPTLEGYQIVAQAIADTAVRAGIVPLNLSSWEKGQGEVHAWLADELAKIPARYRAMGYWGVGRDVYWGGKYEEAYVALREAWKTIRDVPNLGYMLGMLEASRGNTAEAVAILEETEAMEPGNPAVRLLLAESYIMAGHLTKAEPLIESLAGTQEKSAPFHLLRAEARRLRGWIPESQADLVEAERIAPEDASIRMSIVEAYLQQGDYSSAEKQYRQYLILGKVPHPEEAFEAWKRNLAPYITPEAGGNR